MRIALDATYSIGPELSGVGVYSNEILNGLAAFQPSVDFTFCYRPHRFLRSFRRPLGANVRRRPLFDAMPPFFADLFHGLNQRLPERRMKAAVCTFHDLFVMTGDYSTREFRERFTRQAREAAQRSDLVITVSAFTAGQVAALLGIERARLRVIHHGVHPPPAPVEEALREDIVLHVGAIQKRKNVERLVAAFERLPSNWRLVLAGGAGFGAAEILARIAASPARERILVAGYVSRAQLDNYYSRARVFAFPSLDEGFGMPLLDAMAWGVPVITSDRSALPEVAGDAALLVDPTSTDALADALSKLCSESALRDALAARGQARIGNFPWHSAVKKTWAVYREVLG